MCYTANDPVNYIDAWGLSAEHGGFQFGQRTQSIGPKVKGTLGAPFGENGRFTLTGQLTDVVTLTAKPWEVGVKFGDPKLKVSVQITVRR